MCGGMMDGRKVWSALFFQEKEVALQIKKCACVHDRGNIMEKGALSRLKKK